MAFPPMPSEPRKVLRVNTWSNDRQGAIVRTSCLKEFTYKVSPEARCVDFVRETGCSGERTEAGNMGRQGRKVSRQMLPCVLNHRVGA